MVSTVACHAINRGSIPLGAANFRSVAQSGSAPGLGPGGPRFESLYSDQERSALLADTVTRRMRSEVTLKGGTTPTEVALATR
jgi:hypothetical protein